MYHCDGLNENVCQSGPGLQRTRQNACGEGNDLTDYFIYPNREMPHGDLPGMPVFADTLEECARLCSRKRVESERQQAQGNVGGANAYLATFGGGALQGQPRSGVQNTFPHTYCNAFVYDTETKKCWLKNKRMANFQPQDPVVGQTPGRSKATDLHYKGRPQGYPKTIAGYLWRDLVNEPNSVYPNIYAETSMDPETAYQFHTQNMPRWSTSAYALQDKTLGVYDVRPGALLPVHSYCFGQAAPNTGVRPMCGTTFSTHDMSECSRMCAQRPDCNAWTFRPHYRTGSGQRKHLGTCTLGRVREPFYHDVSNEDRAAISGFAIGNLSREKKRFLFGYP